METLGTSKVQPQHRVTLTKEVRAKLGVKVGSLIIFLQNEKGDIVLKKAQVTAV